MNRRRLDQLLVERRLFPSRARAQEAIRAGLVSVGGAPATKPSVHVDSAVEIAVAGDVHPYVSRGGRKLEWALRLFEIDPAGRICLDLGASTGGFTDVLLRNGAARVYAVDVGTGQLHPSLAADPRVANLECIHAKDLDRKLIPQPVDLIVCDVSFISLKQALPPALGLAAPRARLVALVKPQFEVGRSRIGKGGIVRPGYANTYGAAEDIRDWLAAQPGWAVLGLAESPITGGDGNREFLIGAIRSA
jgi:23S rRNA (cytidine1920-2'-O)/16S rRNA (cytidine1409-2'-O)-methyltransferase